MWCYVLGVVVLQFQPLTVLAIFGLGWLPGVSRKVVRQRRTIGAFAVTCLSMLAFGAGNLTDVPRCARHGF